MPPEEIKTQDTQQQDSAQAEPAVVETPAPAPQLTESTPIIEQEETSVAESPIEQTQPKPTPPPPQPQIQERIIYKTDPNIVQKLLIKARAKIQERKRKKLDKIMTIFEAKPQITNKDIQKLLRISSATAVRYLDILESENRIKQVGNTGKSVFYTKI